MHEQMWAPWRMNYIKSDKKDPLTENGCFLCRYRDETSDKQNLVLLRGESSLVVMNRYPYNNGHLLVAPLTHKAALADLTENELLGCMQQLQQLTQLLDNVVKPQGYNIGLNLGQVAGAGLPGHLHWHLVPRWSGDTNFMPVLAGVDVIPQSLDALYELLQSAISDGSH
jgi:ATP adenylyltransferase